MKVLITGSSEGIGLEVAKILASSNNKITLVARNPEKLKTAVSLLHGNGHQVIVADLTVKEDVDGLKKNIDTNKYDVFINNAGVGMYGRFTELQLADQVKMMNLNMTALTVLSYFYLSQAKKGNTLVNLASTLGLTAYAGSSVYAATKAYVVSLSESLWAENKTKGIYVLGFCPGPTYTNFHNVAGGNKDNYSKLILQTPQQVASQLVRAIAKRKKPIVVSGSLNRLMLISQKLMTRKMVVSMMAGLGPLKRE